MMTKNEFLRESSLVAKLAQAVIDIVYADYDGLGVSETLIVSTLQEQGVPPEQCETVIEVWLERGRIKRGPKRSLLPA
jgi:hypothetical protein